MNDADEKRVAEQLRGYLRRIDELIAMAGPGGTGDKAGARSLMKSLKEDLRADHERLTRPRRGVETNAAEDTCLRPAVQGAFCHVKVKWNSNPSGWGSDLAEARVDIGYYLAQLTSKIR